MLIDVNVRADVARLSVRYARGTLRDSLVHGGVMGWINFRSPRMYVYPVRARGTLRIS